MKFESSNSKGRAILSHPHFNWQHGWHATHNVSRTPARRAKKTIDLVLTYLVPRHRRGENKAPGKIHPGSSEFIGNLIFW